MRKVLVPALLAVAFIASTSSSASAFGHLSGLFGHKSCDACCDVEPACGCEVVAPTCGCEVVDPCCARPKFGLLRKLFHKPAGCCDMGCAEPVCGCEVVEPACGCEPACGFEPACGAEPACCAKPRFGALLHKMFHKNHGCDCGCEVVEPACGCEPSCGCGF